MKKSIEFRVDGRILATLASQSQGYGNLMLTPEQQAAFVEELPEVFAPIRGGWGSCGAAWQLGLTTRFEDRPSAAQASQPLQRKDFTWVWPAEEDGVG